MRRRLTIKAGLLALAALALAGAFATSSGAGGHKILLRGPNSSSHLRISRQGRDLVVQGNGVTSPQGCVGGGRNGLTCPLAGAIRLEIQMGPQEDKVEVLDPLPIPVTVRLGNGSDKFLGNDEEDTCYGEGAKRNRCYGYGGDDVCITGPRNSDCLGGLGNDYCRHSTGSDGCWGGPGDDICVMGPGKDGCHGEGGDDKLYGGPDPDQLYGGAGTDYCDGGPGVGYSHTCELGPGH